MNSVFLPELANAKLIDTRTAHGVNSYSYTIAPGERVTIVYIYLTPEIPSVQVALILHLMPAFVLGFQTVP